MRAEVVVQVINGIKTPVVGGQASSTPSMRPARRVHA
jgi:hypothetical protein